DEEGVVPEQELEAVVEVEGEVVVDPHRDERSRRVAHIEAEQLGEERGGPVLVPRPDDGVVQHDGHGASRPFGRLSTGPGRVWSPPGTPPPTPRGGASSRVETAPDHDLGAGGRHRRVAELPEAAVADIFDLARTHVDLPRSHSVAEHDGSTIDGDRR